MTIIAFPRELCRRSSGKISSGRCRCKIYILPVVRLDRPPEKPLRKRSTRKRKSP